eukprot:scaffold274399_cov37-Tisochrysis_lutea.AAC.3
MGDGGRRFSVVVPMSGATCESSCSTRVIRKLVEEHPSVGNAGGEDTRGIDAKGSEELVEQGIGLLSEQPNRISAVGIF